MRSIKSELYLFLKSVILGGSYTDSNDTTQTFKGVSFNDGNKTVRVNHFMFYNSNRDEQPFLSVLFRIDQIETDKHYLKTSTSELLGNVREKLRFSLIVPYIKMSADMRENDYLDHLDICELIHLAVSGQRFYGITTIKKVSESSDDNSGVIMEKEMTFETDLEIGGMTENVDANDTDVNPEAPVKAGVSVTIVKKFSEIS